MTRVAVVQMLGPWPRPDVARSRTLVLLERAVARGAELVVLPELCTVSYDFQARNDVENAAEQIPDGPSVELWSEFAGRTGVLIVAGLPERSGGTLYNTAAVVGPQGLIGRYRKAHLYDWERKVFTAGDEAIGVWDTPVGRVASLICYDLRFAEGVRLALLRGGGLLCVPATWTDRGKPRPWDERGWCGANYLAAGHAYGNSLWVACAARAGLDGKVRTLGCSAIFGPDGYAKAGPASFDGEEVLLADADLESIAKLRSTREMNLVNDRRPELYEELAEPMSDAKEHV